MAGSLEDLPVDRRRRERLLAAIAGDCGDPRVLAAMASLPRHLFVAEDARSAAYEDAPLPIGRGQTISQPRLVAFMLAQLAVPLGARVLDLGAGSGWTAALLARLVGPAGQVLACERHAGLAARAAAVVERVHDAGLDGRVTVLHVDGVQALAGRVFDRIHVGCAAESLPPTLAEALAPGGRLLAPVGPLAGEQILQLVERGPLGFRHEALWPVRFVPLLAGQES